MLAFIIGPLLEKDTLMYKNLFFIAALFALLNIWIISKIPVNLKNKNKNAQDLKKEKISILKPIKEGLDLIKSRRDFALFQLGYMIAGFGLMLIQPIIAIFAVDKLRISHSEYAFAILIFKDLAFVIASPIWGKYFAKMSIMKLTSYMFLSFALFMIVLPFASFNMLWFYVAFILYGIASSGSHLLWNLSGPIFAKEENSSKYTSVNVFMITIRGCIAPALGICLSLFISTTFIFFIGAIFCLFSFYLIFKNQNVFVQLNKNN
jgi:MFS family permease